MKLKKLLLPIDGSRYSRYAADVAWKLAKQTGASVTALHIIDTQSAYQLIGHDEPGFLTKEDFNDEGEVLIRALTRSSHRLADNYSMTAQQHGMESQIFVEEGNPYDVIVEKSQDYDMVVIGHKPYQDVPDNSRIQRQLARLSLAETLAHSSPKPLLVVQGKPIDWKSLTTMISVDHINKLYVNATTDLARQIKLQPTLVCLSIEARQEPPAELISDLRSSDSDLKDVPIVVTGVDKYSNGEFEAWDNPTGNDAWDEWNETLLAMPTRKLAETRITVAGGNPSRFIRYSNLPAVILVPEESLPASGTLQCSAPTIGAHKSTAR